jgi:hypothetical protein
VEVLEEAGLRAAAISAASYESGDLLVRPAFLASDFLADDERQTIFSENAVRRLAIVRVAVKARACKRPTDVHRCSDHA